MTQYKNALTKQTKAPNPLESGLTVTEKQYSDLSDAPNPSWDRARRLVWDKTRGKISLYQLSKKCGRNPAYFHQFLTRGSPAELPERVREILAPILGVSANELRATQDPRNPSSETMTALAAPRTPKTPRTSDAAAQEAPGQTPVQERKLPPVVVILLRASELPDGSEEGPYVLECVRSVAPELAQDARLVKALVAAFS